MPSVNARMCGCGPKVLYIALRAGSILTDRGQPALLLPLSVEHLAKRVHVEEAPVGHPLLARLDAKCADQPQARPLVREDAHDARPALDLLVEALQRVVGAQEQP